MTRLLLTFIVLLACAAHAKVTRPVSITGTASTLTDYQVAVPLEWSTGMRSDFGDVRFFDTDGSTPLPYWIEVQTNGVSAIGWVKVPTIFAGVIKTIYLQYGQGETATTGNGESVFAFFDDFSGTGTNSWPRMGRVSYHRIYNAAFGCLLTDTSGRTVIDASGTTYIYFARGGAVGAAFNADTLTVGQTNTVKALDSDSAWASPHLVIKVSDTFYLMAYSASVSGVGQSTRFAASTTPTGTFSRIEGINIVGATGWELSGSTSWLESGIRYILDTEDVNSLTFWVGIENAGTHRMGWTRVALDKATGAMYEVERYQYNPLSTLLFTNFEWAYGGGNLDQSGLGIGTTNMMIYESRDGAQDFVSVALSENPFFNTIATKYQLDMPLHEETEIEKYQWYVRTNTLFLFYQLQSPDASKGTICRKYAKGELPNASKWTVESAANARVAGGNFVSAITANLSSSADTLSTSSFGLNKVLRFRFQADTTNRVEQIGFRAGGSTGAGACFQLNSEGYFRFFSHDGTTSSGVNLTPIDYGWHTVELSRTTGSAQITLDGTTSTVTTNLSSSTLPILLAGYNGIAGAASKRDYILVREYSATEPAVAVGASTGDPVVGSGVRATASALRGTPGAWRIQ